MEETATGILIDGDLAPDDLRDLALGISAIDAFWAAIAADSGWETEVPPLYRCILSALALRDALRNVGRRDAAAIRSGLHIITLQGEESRSITVGSPDAKKQPRLCNTHVVVRLGGLLLDPTLGQARRYWNAAPRAGILRYEPAMNEHLQLLSNCRPRVFASHRYWSMRGQLQISYFKLPPKSERMSRDWLNAPDALVERRTSLVDSATAILRASEAKLEADRFIRQHGWSEAPQKPSFAPVTTVKRRRVLLGKTTDVGAARHR